MWKDFFYYSKSEQDIYGVLGIEMRLVESDIIYKILEDIEILRDDAYKEFTSKLMPTVDKSSVIGVRLPALRKMAKELVKNPDVDFFLKDLPHLTHEENLLHAFIISYDKNIESVFKRLDEFLPYINNWSVCDSLICKVMNNYKTETFEKVKTWISSFEYNIYRF